MGLFFFVLVVEVGKIVDAHLGLFYKLSEHVCWLIHCFSAISAEFRLGGCEKG